MGYNTTVVVLNDALSAIAEDPHFGKHLAEAIRRACSGETDVDVAAFGSRMTHCNAATVIETHHADHDVFVKVSRNSGQVVTVIDNCRKPGKRSYHAKLMPTPSMDTLEGKKNDLATD